MVKCITKSEWLNLQKPKSCGFCGISGHITTTYALKKGIKTEISGDDSIECLQEKLPINIIESDQSYNIYRTNIDGKTKVNHARYQQLVCSTTPTSNIQPYCDNLIVNISWYDKEGLIVNIYSNVLIESKCVVRFINRKKDDTISLFFTAIKEKLVSKRLLQYKRIR